MAVRGIGAKPLSERGKVAQRPVKPWEEPGLTRPERVIAFLEDLPITAGKLAGTTMKMRPWQAPSKSLAYQPPTLGERSAISPK